MLTVTKNENYEALPENPAMEEFRLHLNFLEDEEKIKYLLFFCNSLMAQVEAQNDRIQAMEYLIKELR